MGRRLLREIFEETKRKPRRLNMTMNIHDFGPVSNASISLKPLTMFVGPNNSGKSYVASLVHSIVSSYAPHVRRPRFPPSRYRIGLRTILENMTDTSDTIRGLLKSGKDTNVPSEILDAIAQKYMAEQADNVLKPEIERNFGSSINDLVRIGKRSFSVEFAINGGLGVCIYNKKDTLAERPELGLNIDIKFSSARNRGILYKPNSALIYEVDSTRPTKVQELELMYDVVDAVEDRIGSELPPNSYYLPAARSGILQGHRALTAGLIRNSAYAGLNEMRIPAMSGVASDFISTIITMSHAEGPFAKIARSLEETILNGEIDLATDSRTGSPEMRYNYKNSAIPLHRTSSTVSELAPIILYLRHVAEMGDLVILEEPEAHLHPAMQIILARHIVKMVRQGLNVLITTHSVFVQNLLSQFLMSGKENKAIRDKLGFDKDDYLLEDEVSPYTFAATRGGAYTAKPTKFSAKDGISSEEFAEAIDNMYNRQIVIEQNMQ